MRKIVLGGSLISGRRRPMVAAVSGIGVLMRLQHVQAQSTSVVHITWGADAALRDPDNRSIYLANMEGGAV